MSEWLRVKKLAEMGVTIPAEDLPPEMVESFLILLAEQSKIESEELKKKARASRGRVGR